MHVFGIAAMAVGVTGLLLLAGHLVWQQVQRLTYLHRLDRWGGPALRASEDEWSEELPEWH